LRNQDFILFFTFVTKTAAHLLIAGKYFWFKWSLYWSREFLDILWSI